MKATAGRRLVRKKPARVRRVLIVEDDPCRVAVFRRHYRSARMAVARNYTAAVRALAGDPFDLVLLDHDLDDPRHNGQDVAAWLTRLPRCRRPTCIVTSTNLRGAFGIVTTLRGAGFRVEQKPFDMWRKGNR